MLYWLSLVAGCAGPTGEGRRTVDMDGDGFSVETDCNDAASDVHPGAAETPGDGIDSDCDGSDSPTTPVQDLLLATVHGLSADDGFGDSVACSSAGVLATQASFGATATQWRSGYDHPGYALVFDGASRGELSAEDADLQMDGSESWESLGDALVFPGDLTGDGYNDVLIGSIGHGDRIADHVGAAWLFSPERPGELVAGDASRMYVGDKGDSFGVAARAPDLDEDGVPELLISATSAASSAIPGTLFLFSGAAGGQQITTDSALWSSTDADPGSVTGKSVAFGDLDADGNVDLIHGRQVRPDSVGVAWGPWPEWDLGPGSDWIHNDGEWGSLGSGVVVGDWNGDGFDDLAVSAHVAPGAAGDRAGQVRVYFGPRDRAQAGSADLILEGERPFAWMGSGLASADVDGDGIADLLIGASADPYFAPTDVGRIYLFLGPLSDSEVPDRVILGHEPGDLFGHSLAACDLDGDGADELVVGADGAVDGVPYVGRVTTLDLDLQR